MVDFHHDNLFFITQLTQKFKSWELGRHDDPVDTDNANEKMKRVPIKRKSGRY